MPHCKKECEKLFDIYFDKYYQNVRYYALTFLKNDNDADEVAQQVFMILWQNIQDIDHSHDIAGYIFTSAKWKCLNILYKQKKNVLYGNTLERGELDIKLDINRAVHSDVCSIYSSEILNLIKKNLDKMSQAMKETFIGVKFGEHTYKEMADIQKCSVKTIEYRMTIALKILREALKDYLPLLLGLWLAI